MKMIKQSLLVPVILALMMPAIVFAQQFPEETATPLPEATENMSVGDSLTIRVTEPGAPAAVYIALEIAEASYYTIAARAADSTNPIFGLFNPVDRELIYVDDNPNASDLQQPTDAVLEDLFLIPGTYTLAVERGEGPGSGEITVTVTQGEAGILGLGQITVIEAELREETRLHLPVNLEANEVLSIYGIALQGDPDLQLRLIRSGRIIAENDDHESQEWILGDFDPKLEQIVVPEAGAYIIEVRGFSEVDAGTFDLVIVRYGYMNPVPDGDITFSGETLARARNPFTLSLQSGNYLTITARAVNPNLDPELYLLDPNLIYVAVNDDHQTEDPDLGEFDARISNFVAEQTGDYTLELNSVSGSGAFEVTVEFIGRFEPGTFEPLDVSGLQTLPLSGNE
jgi:nitrous oxide reductase accessory protein NosL